MIQLETVKNLDDDNETEVGVVAAVGAAAAVVVVTREENCRLTEWLSIMVFSKTVFFTALHIPPTDSSCTTSASLDCK